jgi:hypothetical protein
MCWNKHSKTLVALTFAGALAIAATPGAQAQGAPPQGPQSWCLTGSGDLQACGFASFEQCELARDGFAMCVASDRPAEPAYREAESIYHAAIANAKLEANAKLNANAKLVGSVKRHHAR